MDKKWCQRIIIWYIRHSKKVIRDDKKIEFINNKIKHSVQHTVIKHWGLSGNASASLVGKVCRGW